MTSSSLNAIDTFAGAGGVSLGLKWAGFDVRAAFDFNAPAVRTYQHNLGDHGFVAASEDLTGAELLAAAGLKRGECDLLVGGPPCQGFSVQRRGKDVDARNDLVLDYLRLVDQIMPRAFLMENVPALAGRRGKSILDEFVRRARNLGYAVETAILDAADFGVPQHRRRMFVIGVQHAEAIVWPTTTHGEQSWRTVRDAIGDLEDPRSLPTELRPPNHDADNISDLNRLRISFVPEGGGRADIPVEHRLACHQVPVETAGHRGVYGRLWWDRPAGTITTKCNSFTRGRFAHPVDDRNISMREAARLQGFPDDFVFLGGRVDVAHQIGNAVPPPLAMAVGGSLAKMLSDA